MIRRRHLKAIHEHAVITAFCRFLTRAGEAASVVSYPDPPDGIVHISGRRNWVEITDAFLDDELAIDITANACDRLSDPKVPHRRFVLEPDDTFVGHLDRVINEKYHKKSIRAVAATEGPGILLVGVFTPFMMAKSVAEGHAIPIVCRAADLSPGVFDRVYCYGDGGRDEFFRVVESRT